VVVLYSTAWCYDHILVCLCSLPKTVRKDDRATEALLVLGAVSNLLMHPSMTSVKRGRMSENVLRANETLRIAFVKWAESPDKADGPQLQMLLLFLCEHQGSAQCLSEL
jgi:hypothetical protein